MSSRVLALFLILRASPVAAQTDWTTVDQPAIWLNTFVDHAISPRTALWFDGHWRRDGWGDKPQQVLLRPGLQVALRPGLRVGGGYAYIATAPYGASPNAAPLREHRAWQQVSLRGDLGDVALTHRLRWEQRWLAAVGPDGVLSAPSYQQRLRYMVRAQRPLASGASSPAAPLGFVSNEIFLPVGHSDGAQRRLQNRAQIGVGLPVSARQRLELSYLHQWNRITPRRTHEFNHTAMLSWVWTSRR